MVSSVPPLLARVAPSLVVTVLGLLPIVTGSLGPAALPFLVVQAIPLVWRDTAPWTVLTVTSLGALGQLLVGPGPSNANLAQWFAVAAVVKLVRWPASVLPPAALVALSALVILPRGGADLGAFFVAVASGVVAWAFGDAVARNAALRASAEEDVRRRQESAELTARAEALTQRLRIGDELHHRVGGALDAIIVQVRAARLTPPSSAAFGARVNDVETVGRQALAEMDRFLGLLRTADEEQPAAPRTPPDAGASARAPIRTTPAVRALVAIAPVVLLLALVLWESSDRGALSVPLVALACLQLLPLAARDLAPLAVLALTSSGVAAQLVAGDPLANGVMGIPLAVYAVAAHGGGRRAVVLTCSLLAVLSVLSAGFGLGYAVQLTLVVGVFSAGALYAGAAARAAADDRLAVLERLARADQDAQERVRAAVAAEKLAMARELHDSVGHTLSLIVLQAGAARVAGRQNPDGAIDALRQMERAAVTALSEMDRAPACGEEQGPGLMRLADLPGLVRDVHRAGVAVRLEVLGPTDDVPPAMQSSVYRIVQEALTNVVKHAGPVPAVVTLARREGRLHVTITNDAPPGSVPVTGRSGRRGLTGMAERVALFDGRLEAGPTTTGFTVAVELPLPVPEDAARGPAVA